LIIPARLIDACGNRPKHEAWLAQLPDFGGDLEKRWSLALGPAFDSGRSAWVAPVKLADGSDAVLKIGMPHSESEHEIDGLRFWNGKPTVRLLDADRKLGAMLLERCEPGLGLWMQPKPEQDLVLGGVLKRLRRMPADPHPFRHLSVMVAGWSKETLADAGHWSDAGQGPDAGLVREGLRLLAELAGTATREVLLATDLHAGNVLRAQREPWIAIDPRPYVGDPAYDATQHLLNSATPGSDPDATIRGFAEIAELDPERVRLWTFARAAAQPRDDWSNDPLMELARAIAP
jgi:streptomycin 6-kinase